MSKAAPELHPVPVVSPWHHIGIDFVGPLTPSTQGHRYIATSSPLATTSVNLCRLMRWNPSMLLVLLVPFSRYGMSYCTCTYQLIFCMHCWSYLLCSQYFFLV